MPDGIGAETSEQILYKLENVDYQIEMKDGRGKEFFGES